jgi:hypothetical protein
MPRMERVLYRIQRDSAVDSFSNPGMKKGGNRAIGVGSWAAGMECVAASVQTSGGWGILSFSP